VLYRPEIPRIWVKTAADAVAAAREHGPVLVVLAFLAPDETASLARTLRGDPRTRPTAIVVVLAERNPALEAAVAATGANAVLSVPVDPLLWDPRLAELLTVPPRREQRIPVRLEDWSRFVRDQEFDALVVNIGARGALVETARPLELGAKIGLGFALPDTGQEVRVVGQVVRHAAAREGVHRAGVEFLIFRGDAQRQITAFAEAPGATGRQGASRETLLSLAGKTLSGDGGEWEEELRASEVRKAVILDSALDPIVTVDHEGRIVEFNSAARRVFGYSRDEVFGRQVADTIVPPSLRAALREAFGSFLETGDLPGGLGQRLETMAMRADGSEFPIEVAVFPAYVKGRALLTAFLRDLSERKGFEDEQRRTVEALRASEARIARIADAIPGAVYQFRVDAEGRRSFPFMSRGAADLFGFTSSDIESGREDVWGAVHALDRQAVLRSIQTSADDLLPWNEMFRVAAPTGTKWLHGQAVPTREPGGSTVWNGIFLDVTGQKSSQDQMERLNRDLDRRLLDLREAEAELQRLARYDSLTGLSNRSFFLETLSQVLVRAERRRSRVGLVFIDLDGFKAVNDNLGHDAGDQLLRIVAERIRRSTRRSDAVARIGGDEFTVIVQDLERGDDAAVAAQTILDELQKPCTIGDREIPPSASVGIAVYPEDGRDGASLLRHADLAMYRAKQEGKSTYRFFTPAMSRRAHERMLLLGNLKRAIDRQEFALRYQPVVHRDGPLLSLEALLRWEHPEMGEVSPDRFIATAEESGLMVAIGAFVLRTACTFVQSLGRPDLRVAVNLSARQFLQPDCAALVAEALQATGLEPGRLEIEVTEAAVMSEIDDVAPRMVQLRQLGVQVTLDDFGTGYTSLAHLKRLRFDRIKIDRSFVRSLPGDPENAALVSAMLAMARGLGLEVVAEGVETKEQVAFLEEQGCRAFQGYFFSPPLETAAVRPFLSTFRG
jgi:diguanylate cyclase (GGDEF)-like protein/PAS domain S-box-containing protein